MLQFAYPIKGWICSIYGWIKTCVWSSAKSLCHGISNWFTHCKRKEIWKRERKRVSLSLLIHQTENNASVGWKMNQANQKTRLVLSVHTFARQALLLLCHSLITRLKDEVHPEKHTKMQHHRQLGDINYNEGDANDKLPLRHRDTPARLSKHWADQGEGATKLRNKQSSTAGLI